ncbi:MAG: 3-deoxy-7-phosphoheptulonate synthase [Treponemataceae bacterium]
MNIENKIKNKRILRMQPVISPAKLQAKFSVSENAYKKIEKGREEIKNILQGNDNRFLIIVGPCSIHDRKASLEFAKLLCQAQKDFADKFLFVMRLYFEKPRTSLGWRGLILEPDFDGLINMEKGLSLAREIACEVAEQEILIATEFLDPIVPQYISDLVSWASVGARSVESQIHRELASGLSMPVGFKNATDGNIQSSINAIISARKPHGFLGITEEGISAIMHTSGNKDAHLVLRGSEKKPNYKPTYINKAVKLLNKANLPTNMLVDCSHGNSCKKALRQITVFESLIKTRLSTNFKNKDKIRGVMMESFLHTGKVKVKDWQKHKNYGFSITDECLGWKETRNLFEKAYKKFPTP